MYLFSHSIEDACLSVIGMHLVPVRWSVTLLELLGTPPELLDAEHLTEVHGDVHDSDDEFRKRAEYVECGLEVIEIRQTGSGGKGT